MYQLFPNETIEYVQCVISVFQMYICPSWKDVIKGSYMAAIIPRIESFCKKYIKRFFIINF